MARQRSIILVCLIILGIGAVFFAPLEYPQDSEKTLNRRSTRQLRIFDKAFEETSTMSDTDASRWQFEETRRIITERTEGEEAARNQMYEEMWSLAEEMLEMLWEEDKRNRSKAAKLDDRKIETHRNESGQYGPFVATTERQRDESSEARRKKQREYRMRYKKRQTVERRVKPKVAEEKRKRRREYEKRRRARKTAMAKLNDAEWLATQRKKQKEYNGRYQERRKAARLKNPKEAEAQRKKHRECVKSYRERRKVAISEKPELREAQRELWREAWKRKKERAKLANVRIIDFGGGVKISY